MYALWTIAWAVLAAAGTPNGDPVVADVAGHPMTAEEVRARIDGPADADAIRAAVLERATEHLQAQEARRMLGEAVEGLPEAEAAERLRRHLFPPGRVCRTVPERLRRHLYRETRWRFVAPPAWTVDDVQLLCCRDRRRCGDPETVACLDAQRDLARRIRTALPDEASAGAFAGTFEELSRDNPRLAFRRYTFYYDPEEPDGDVDRRLQEVDAPVAEAVARLEPGGVAGPVTTRFGHHVLRLHARRDGVDLGWDDPRTQAVLRTELCPELLLTLHRRYARDLAREASVELRFDGIERAFGAQVAAALGAPD
ncbi:MAG: foldase protein PrsA [Myxococcota bacterium]